MRTKQEKLDLLQQVIKGELSSVVLKPRKVRFYIGNLDNQPELENIGINNQHRMSVNGKAVPVKWLFDNLFNDELIKGRDDSDIEVIKF
jgi:hypothetical protein